ncbi:hypothetical protein HNR39_003613 [Glaciimonas immobilis]|uniref:Uncharacterized protein n=1 Tax=Glaciimonas immobilis TaxID=728004 RepID=A0A840RV80_9BURK|nr:hypothetical protein [Glaciimonas immobilis]
MFATLFFYCHLLACGNAAIRQKWALTRPRVNLDVGNKAGIGNDADDNSSGYVAQPRLQRRSIYSMQSLERGKLCHFFWSHDYFVSGM